jgi:hypothetical protein
MEIISRIGAKNLVEVAIRGISMAAFHRRRRRCRSVFASTSATGLRYYGRNSVAEILMKILIIIHLALAIGKAYLITS